MRRARIASALASSALAALGLALGGVASPAAAAGGLQVSLDGVTFASALPHALFDDIAISVPGDSQSTELYIRNTGPVAGYLRVSLLGVTVSDPVLADALTVSASTLAHPGEPVELSDARPCQVLTEGDLLAPGDTVRLSSVLSLGDLAGLGGQGGSARFSFRVSLSDAAVRSLLPTACGSGTDLPAAGGDGRIPLAMTGSEPPLPWIIAAASALGIGLFAAVAARRRRRAEE
jgi:hypothetical protein